jgi:uncharacterized membrane protein
MSENRRMGSFVFAVAAVVFQLGCGEKIDPVSGDFDPVDGGVTYSEDMKPILDENCIRCHASDKSGPERNGAPLSVNLDTYEGASASSEAANVRVQSGSMPPIGPLDSADRELFQQWVEDGAPQ